MKVRVIGGGLAGCEAALQLASMGFKVKLFEMKPHKKTPAQKLDGLAELVCSNSFRSTKKTNAVALLKDEMVMMDSFLLKAALKAQIPAGDAFAVDRNFFSALVEEQIANNSSIELIKEEITFLPNDDIPTILATGPLTSDALAQALVSLIGQERLDFYDAIAPIIDAESVDMTKAFVQSRWQEGEDGGDYVNCPMTKEIYENFVNHLVNSSKAKKHDFEDAHYFEGCLPLEVMAERGIETLRFGPFKPVGLANPHTGERPYAVLQLRKEDKYGTSFNLVGCQTRMTIPEQKAAFSLIPGLEQVKFMRFGSVHRNTYVDSPKVLDKFLRLKKSGGEVTNIFLAGQISGVEGYVESMAMGIVAAHMVKSLKVNNKTSEIFPPESALGALYGHVLGFHRASDKLPYVPSNITWAMFPPVECKKSLGRAHKRNMLYERGIEAINKYKAKQQVENLDSISL